MKYCLVLVFTLKASPLPIETDGRILLPPALPAASCPWAAQLSPRTAHLQAHGSVSSVHGHWFSQCCPEQALVTAPASLSLRKITGPKLGFPLSSWPAPAAHIRPLSTTSAPCRHLPVLHAGTRKSHGFHRVAFVLLPRGTKQALKASCDSDSSEMRQTETQTQRGRDGQVGDVTGTERQKGEKRSHRETQRERQGSREGREESCRRSHAVCCPAVCTSLSSPCFLRPVFSLLSTLSPSLDESLIKFTNQSSAISTVPLNPSSEFYFHYSIQFYNFHFLFISFISLLRCSIVSFVSRESVMAF